MFPITLLRIKYTFENPDFPLKNPLWYLIEGGGT